MAVEQFPGLFRVLPATVTVFGQTVIRSDHPSFLRTKD